MGQFCLFANISCIGLSQVGGDLYWSNRKYNMQLNGSGCRHNTALNGGHYMIQQDMLILVCTGHMMIKWIYTDH